MTSIGPYDNIHEMNHMWDFTDIRGKFPINAWRLNGIMGTLKRLGTFTKFLKIIKMANMEHKFDHTLFDSTIFVVDDKTINDDFIDQMDTGTARQIIDSFLISGQLDPEFIKSSPMSYYTNKRGDNILVSNINNDTYVNQNSLIVNHFVTDNGIIYQLDSLCIN